MSFSVDQLRPNERSTQFILILLAFFLLTLACTAPVASSGPPTHEPRTTLQQTWATALFEGPDVRLELVELYQNLQRATLGHETPVISSLEELVDFASVIRFSGGSCFVFTDKISLWYAEDLGLSEIPSTQMIGIGETTTVASLVDALACYPTYYITTIKHEGPDDLGVPEVRYELQITDQTGALVATLHHSGNSDKWSVQSGDALIPLDQIELKRKLEAGEHIVTIVQGVIAAGQVVAPE